MTTSSRKYSRRLFLESLGLSGALLPLVGTDKALAAPGGTPLRVLFVVWTNGYVMDDWRPGGSETAPTFKQTLSGLNAFKDKTLVIDGVGQRVQYEANPKALGWGKDQYYGGHDAYPGVMTGVPMSKYADNLEWSGADSLDQFIGKELSLMNPGVPSEPLVFGPFSEGGYGGTASYKGASPGVTPEKDPFALFKRLFEGRGLPKADLDRILGTRRSVLDYVSQSLTSFGQRLGVEDKRRIDAHFETIRVLEKQLEATAAAPPSAMSCSQPDASVKFDVSKDYVKSMALFQDLVVTAFKCDLNRVGTMMMSNCGGDHIMFSWLGNEFTGKGDEYPTRQYHDITHNQDKSAEHKRRKIMVEEYFFKQVGLIAQKLQDTTDAAGTPMLDNTLIVVTNAMGVNHDSKVQPFTLVGNVNKYFKTGRFLRYSNEAHNRVLVAIANSMGVDGSKFGVKQYATELPRLRG